MTIKYLHTINTPIFIFGLIFGIITAYLLAKPSKIVVRHKKEKGKLVYEDNDAKCYKYVAEEIKCPGITDLLEHPIIYN